MWKAVRDLLTRALESIGVEVPGPPELGRTGGTVSGSVEAIGRWSGEVARTATGAGSEATPVQARLRG